MKCLACDGDEFKLVIDFGCLPLANSFMTAPLDLPKYPLAVIQCKTCTHFQLKDFVNPSVLFEDYKYVSGTTKTLKQHFKELAESYSSVKSHLDIGCNDGSLMEQFKTLGIRTYGIDPAKNLRQVTIDKGLDVLVDFWSEDVSNYFGHKFELITTLNCFAHNPNPLDFLRGCANVLADDGKLLIEFPYILNTLEKVDIGQIYAEHYNYFTIWSLSTLAVRAGLGISELTYFDDLHGGTIRIILTKSAYNGKAFDTCQESIKLTDNNIREFQVKVGYLISDLHELLLAETGNIVAYGASAKSSTLFNLIPKAAKKLKFIVDDCELKQGLFCPGSNLEIKSIESLVGMEDLTVLITAHNFKDEIISRLKSLDIKAKIINYTPKISVEEV
jgi:SAM-dependent methyltransferase